MHRLDPQTLPAYTDRLYRAAWALCGSREEAEDLVQETFVRTLARPRLVRGDSDLAYLLRGLRNTFAESLRTADRRPRTVGLADHLAAIAPAGRQPEVAAEANEVFSAIADLAADFRDSLIAVDVMGLSYAEAGRALGAKEATIATRVFRGRSDIAERFADQTVSKPGPQGVVAEDQSVIPRPDKHAQGRPGSTT
jgi:RNA polymerase sigma-70 factor (ECF subfamily)